MHGFPLHHLLFPLLPTFFVSCVFAPPSRVFSPSLISPAMMPFELTRQEIRHSLLRGDVVMNRARARGRRKAAASPGEKAEQSKTAMAKDPDPPPAQSPALFNYHGWHGVDVSLTEGHCFSNPEIGILAGDGGSSRTLFFLSFTLKHLELFASGSLSAQPLTAQTCNLSSSYHHPSEVSPSLTSPSLFLGHSPLLIPLPIRSSPAPLTPSHTHP